MGGLPGFRQQDQVHGLPLQLSPEEVTLALSRGWVTLYEAPDPLADVTADEGGAQPGIGATAAIRATTPTSRARTCIEIQSNTCQGRGARVP